MIGRRGEQALDPPCASKAHPCALLSHPAQPFPAPRGPPLLRKAREPPAGRDARRDDRVSPSANR
jgi:hypothetical protein